LQLFADNWAAQVDALRAFIREYRTAHAGQEHQDRTLLPFLRLLSDAAPRGRPPADVAAATVQMVELIRGEIGRVDFWRNPVAQGQLRSQVEIYLDDRDLVPLEQQAVLADQIVQTAKANHTLLVKRDA
jgi:hypothetical protein